MTTLRSLMTSVAVASMLGGLSLPAYAQAIDVAIIGEPDTLDPMVSTKDVVSTVTQHFYETLFTFNGSWEVVPLLAAEMPEIADDGKTYTIPIREGVTFHDGSTMDAHDVVDSLKRWTEVATRGRGVADKIDSITALDDYTVEIKMNEAYSPLLSLLAFSNSAAAVYPQENLGETIAEVIGTGPYKLGEHRPDQYIQVVRFDDYASRTEPSDGASGERKLLLDEIRFIFVPDPNTRLEGLLSGQYDFAEGLETQAYDRLAGSDVAEPMLLEPFGWPVFAFNHKAGLMADESIRLAVQAALAPEDMLYAAFGDEKFFQVDGALYPEGYFWRNEAGLEFYNEANPERAAEYLEAADYDGTPLRILTSHQYEFHFKMAEVAKVYLEAAGFTVDMQVVDWATLGERRNVPDLWDIYITHSPFLPEPALTSMYAPTSRLGWENEAKDAVLDAFTTETEPEKRLELFTKLQALLFEQAAFYKVGNFNALLGKSKKLEGVEETPWPFFWNASVAE